VIDRQVALGALGIIAAPQHRGADQLGPAQPQRVGGRDRLLLGLRGQHRGLGLLALGRHRASRRSPAARGRPRTPRSGRTGPSSSRRARARRGGACSPSSARARRADRCRRGRRAVPGASQVGSARRARPCTSKHRRCRPRPGRRPLIALLLVDGEGAVKWRNAWSWLPPRTSRRPISTSSARASRSRLGTEALLQLVEPELDQRGHSAHSNPAGAGDTSHQPVRRRYDGDRCPHLRRWSGRSSPT
jgi:hypothetical protein